MPTFTGFRPKVRVSGTGANGTNVLSQLLELQRGTFGLHGATFVVWFHATDASGLQQQGAASGAHVVLTPFVSPSSSSSATSSNTDVTSSASASTKVVLNVHFDFSCKDPYETEFLVGGDRYHLQFNPHESEPSSELESES